MKLESLKDSKFEMFKENVLVQLNKVKGGEVYGTNDRLPVYVPNSDGEYELLGWSSTDRADSETGCVEILFNDVWYC